MLFSAKTRNILAATPGLVFMPAPTNDTFAISASCVTPLAPISFATRETMSSATFMSAFGIVNEMSVRPSFEVFCTIMSTLTFALASPSNNAAEIPGRSGTPTTVTFDSLAS